MTSDDIQQAIGEFELAAKMALEAGFDGVEIHAANGYLLDQFLNPISNLRADEWGGSIENLCRFPLAVIEKVASAISEAKVGVRISPFGRYNGMTPNTQYKNLYDYFIQKLNRIDCQYLHIADHPSHRSTPYNLEFLRQLKHDFKNRVIRCGGYRLDSAESEIEIGNADLIAFGRPFISNENLVKKLQNKQDLEPEDFDQYP